MYILEHVPLQTYSTMRLGGPAAYLTEINERQEIAKALAWATKRQLPVVMIGGGSNIFWTDQGFPGLVMVNKITGYEVLNEDDLNVYITIGAGEIWDSVVERAVKAGYSGIEQLSLIPGSTGATPIQNVGAYGREISDTLVSVEAFDKQANQLINLQAAECSFGYRTSRFRTTDKGRFFITAVTLHLTHANPQPPFYESLANYLHEHKIKNYTPQVIRDAVVAIRRNRLPDPAQVANNGSFFYNPIVDEATFTQLHAENETIVYWPLENDKYKISAAWLIDQAGFKNIHDTETGMATWPNQSLVLINEKAKSTADLLKFKQKIADAVKAQFSIALQQEPEMLGVSSATGNQEQTV